MARNCDCRIPYSPLATRYSLMKLMKRLLLEGPAVEPVLLAEAKAHLRLDTDDEDDLVGALIARRASRSRPRSAAC